MEKIKHKKQRKKRRRRCDICGNLKYDVETCINPYDQDINGVDYKEAICFDCHNSLCGDI